MSEIDVSKNLKTVLENIKKCTLKCGRNADSVKLLAVSKFHPSENILKAFETGQLLFGENRVQEAFQKFPPLKEKNPSIELHIIGQLQSNKVKKACQIADVIESVDRLELITEINKHCSSLNKKIRILFEVHTGEESKSGFDSFEKLEEAVKFCADGNAPFVIPSGFMTMAPFTDDKTLVRKSFVTLRQYAEQLSKEFPHFTLTELSMGMSEDYEIAIEEGSTEVRIGTAIFGPREY